MIEVVNSSLKSNDDNKNRQKEADLKGCVKCTV